MIEHGRAMAPARYDEHVSLAHSCRARLGEVFHQADVLLTLSAPGEAPEGLAATGNPVFNRLWTVLGMPCIHLPCAMGPRGLPLGVQVVGKIGDDRALLEAADWISSVLRRS